MKILVVSSYYPPHLGGLEIVAQNQAIRLAELGHKVTVVTSKVARDETSGEESGVQVIRVRALNISEKWGAPFPVFAPSLLLLLYRQTKNADVVHIHDAFYMSSFIAAVCAKMNKTPVVLMQHIAMINHPSKVVMAVQRLVYATTGAIIFRISDRIITLNDRVEGFLKDRGVHAKNLIAIPNGVDMTVFFPAHEEEKILLKNKFGFDTKRKTILFVGRFVPKKGFLKLLDAKDSAYQIAFCGGERPENVPQDDANLLFLGQRTPEEVAEMYRAADIFALPSEDEGFPLSVQEAMATGLPVVTSNDPGYARYLFDPTGIFLLDKPNGETLRSTFRALVSDDQQLEQMSQYSLDYAKRHFNWDTVIKSLEETYVSLVEAKQYHK